jgi:DsbC/DsbD-like thiol-disulfide interchange protein
MRNSVLIFSFAILLSVTCTAAVETTAQTVSGSIGPLTRGKSARGTVVLTIPGGLHVNSNRPNSEYAIPTSVRLTATGGRASRVTYPRGRNRKFQFSESTINVYEGRVSFPFTLSIPAGFKGNTVRVRAVVRYQACTDEVCYPPRNKEITLTAKIR